MAGIFDRIKPDLDDGVERIPIQPFLNSFWCVLEGILTPAQVIAHFNLIGDELTDYNTILAKTQADLAALDDAGKEAYRQKAFHQNLQLLFGLEYGFVTEAQARARLGI